MNHQCFAAALLTAQEAAVSTQARADFARVAALAEAAVLSGALRWRHEPVGPAGLRKKPARVALVRELEGSPWWWASLILRAWRRERPVPAALRWHYGHPDTRRAAWAELLRIAGWAAAEGEPSEWVALAAAELIARGVAPWVARVIARVPEVRSRRRGAAVSAWSGDWLAAAALEGWRPPGVRIVLHTGPMGSGKSTALVAAATGADLVVQAAMNTRDGGAVRTHDGAEVPARAAACLWREVAALVTEAGDRPIRVVVDEGQWFSQEDWTRALCLLVGRRAEVVIGALDWSAQRTRLGSAGWLLSAADEVQWHRGRCVDCGAPSTITRWDGEGPPGVGSIGPGAYRPVCDAHWRAPRVDGGGR